MLYYLPRGGKYSEIGLIKKQTKITTYTETYFQNEGKSGEGKVAAPTKVIKPKLEQEQITLVPEAKSEEETVKREKKIVQMFSQWASFTVSMI